jgi:hypothetical protein
MLTQSQAAYTIRPLWALTKPKSPFWVGLFYIFDKLLAVPTARVARKLAPLAFGTGLSLLGALPPNPHPSLLSLIPLLSFTQSHSLTQFYSVSFPYSVLLSLIP